MARLLAVDWDRHEARYVLATSSGENLKIRAATSVPLVDVAEGGNAPHPDVGGSLRAALADQQVTRAVTLVGVERASIELLHFTLPPATDRELPELVANQAMRESQLVTEQSRLDFVPEDDNATGPRNVTAAVLSSEQFEQIQATCQTAGLKPKRLLLRPYASASLFRRVVPRAERICLLMNLVAEEVDLIFLVEGRVVFFRTVRLPNIADREKATARLLTEVNRTLVVAAQSRLSEEMVECVYLFGSPDEHEGLSDRIRDQLSLPVVVIDPFAAVDAPGDLVEEHSGRFASLLGMLLDEALNGGHAIDFVHPRRQPEPPNRRRMALRIAALLGIAALVVTYYMWTTLSDLDADVSQRFKQLRELDASAKRAAKQQQLVAEIRNWQASDVAWLDELRDLSLRFPSGRDIVVLGMSMSAAPNGGGAITLNGLVRAPDIVDRLERNIRDQHHEISSKRVQQRLREKSHTWHFESSMSVARRNKAEYGGQEVVLAGADAPGAPQGMAPEKEVQQVNEP